jgi:hypothetical protein
MLPMGPCSLRPPGNKRTDEEARKAAGLGPDDGAQRGRISFELVKGLISESSQGRTA